MKAEPRLNREFFADKGARGGASRSPLKMAAAHRNLLRTPNHVRRTRPTLPGPEDYPATEL